MKAVKRQSGIELLRIICLLLIMLGHTYYMARIPDVHTDILSFSAGTLIESIGVGSVDVFILISGWFGIHYSTKGLTKMFFQFFFLVWGIWGAAFACGLDVFSPDKMKGLLGVTEGYWFVFSYAGLYILSPILNRFAETATKKEFLSLLIAAYVFQSYYTWVTDTVNCYNGYGITLFCILYLTARYFRKYPIRIIEENVKIVYVLGIMAISLITVLGYYYFGNALRMLRYDNPLVILVSLAVVIIFSRFTFHNKIINWLAASAFSVYIIHFHQFVFPYFGKGLNSLLNSIGDNWMIFGYIVFLVLVYLVCTLIDQIRILMWRLIVRIMEIKMLNK